MRLAHRSLQAALALFMIGCIARIESAPIIKTAAVPPASVLPTEPTPASETPEDTTTIEQRQFQAALAEAEALCDLGHGERCVRVGLAYGQAPVQDLAKAATILSRACELGEAPGCFEYGNALLAGRGVEPDRDQGSARIKQACEMGLVGACMHSVVEQVSPEQVLAAAERACIRGNSSACMKAGQLMLRGNDTREGVARALRYLGRACKSKVKRACRTIGMIYEKGIGKNVDRKRAVALYREYCSDGDLDSCCYLGLLTAEGRLVDPDPVQALTLWDSCCNRGSTTCCLDAGMILSDGAVLPIDTGRALGYLRRSCDGGDSEGCAALAEGLEKGFAGVGVDLIGAARAYQRGCELRHFRSCERLMELRKHNSITH